MKTIDADSLRRKAVAAKQAARDAIAQRKIKKYVDMPEPTGNAEVDSMADLTELQKGYRKRAQEEKERFETAVDSEFWCALCFRTRAQKMAFLRAMKWVEYGDKYVNGELVAADLGIDLPDKDLAGKSVVRIDKDFASLTQ